MLPTSPCFVLYLEMIKDLNLSYSQLKGLINKYSFENIYFFTNNCDISIKSLISELNSMKLLCNPKNVMTPTYLLIKYCKALMPTFSAYPISYNNDLWDFYAQDIKINYENPDIIFICTNNLRKKHLDLIQNSNIPIAISSNLCINRLANCTSCTKKCYIKTIISNYKNRVILPDPPPFYNSSIYKQLNIQPKHTVLISHSLRDDYIQYKRTGCKFVLILKDKKNKDKYLNLPHSIDIVADNFDNLSNFLNLK
ncbi:hypothetical protein ACER0A_009860 [Haloimpatiens sp. FM7315]|uniref:hypothetical protein n=1 Tax=Haloimpatiens sp. FM7315 TaxID=3298609 RepID=UPI00370C72F4